MDAQKLSEHMELVNAWWAAQATLEAAKKAEAKLRKELQQKCFEGAAAGTHNIELGGGYKFKASIKQTTSIVKAAKADNGALVQAAVQQCPSLGRVFSYEPKMSMTAYKLLTEDERAAMSSLIEVKDSTPSFEMVAPKE